MRHLIIILGLLCSLAFSACNSSDDPGVLTYSVGGAVSGLTSPGLVLQLNGGNDLTVNTNGSSPSRRDLPAGPRTT